MSSEGGQCLVRVVNVYGGWSVSREDDQCLVRVAKIRVP